jgi:hypothetical protein
MLPPDDSSRFFPEGGVARVPEAEIERLKAGVPLVALAEAAGVELRRTGADLTGRCPFHEDGTPSLVISPGKNLWHCLGACQAGGSVIDWVMRAEGVSFRHAVELLRDGRPAVSPAGAGPKRSTARKLAPPVERAAADHELLGQVIDYYHRVLGESPDVPRTFRTADLWLIHAVSCDSRYSSRTCRGDLYWSPECRRFRLYQNSMYRTTSR